MCFTMHSFCICSVLILTATLTGKRLRRIDGSPRYVFAGSALLTLCECFVFAIIIQNNSSVV